MRLLIVGGSDAGTEHDPLRVKGPGTLVDADGTPYEVKGKTSYLCRCGASSTKPFCDGSLSRVGFERAGYSHVQLAEAIAMLRSGYSLLEREGLALHDDVAKPLADLLRVDAAAVTAAYQRTRERRGTRHGHWSAKCSPTASVPLKVWATRAA